MLFRIACEKAETVTVDTDSIKALQASLSHSWIKFREARKAISDRDLTIVNVFREYISEVAQTLLRVTGEVITIDMSDRFIDVLTKQTRVVVTFRSEEFRHFKFKPITINVAFSEASVSVQGGTAMSREAKFYLPEFNLLLQKHLQPENLDIVVAGDYNAHIHR